MASTRPPRLLDRVRQEVRLRHFSRATERAYVDWIKRFVVFHRMTHPEAMGETEVTAFLSHLAVRGSVSASTQNQALAAIVFLYKHVLRRDLEWLDDVVRAKRPRRIPTVLTRGEVEGVLAHLDGMPGLMALLMYGAGLRLSRNHPNGSKPNPSFFRQLRPDRTKSLSALARPPRSSILPNGVPANSS